MIDPAPVQLPPAALAQIAKAAAIAEQARTQWAPIDAAIREARSQFARMAEALTRWASDRRRLREDRLAAARRTRHLLTAWLEALAAFAVRHIPQGVTPAPVALGTVPALIARPKRRTLTADHLTAHAPPPAALSLCGIGRIRPYSFTAGRHRHRP